MEVFRFILSLIPPIFGVDIEGWLDAELTPQRECAPLGADCETTFPACCDGSICRYGRNPHQYTCESLADQIPSPYWEGPYSLGSNTGTGIGSTISPVVPSSAANLPDGRILTWSSFLADDQSSTARISQTWTSIFDPSSVHSPPVVQRISHTRHDMFCPGTAVLPNGELLVTGGTTDRAVSIYNPMTDAWRRGPSLQIPRGYHSMTVLPDGSVFTLGGSWSGGLGGKMGEVWIPSSSEMADVAADADASEVAAIWSVLPGISIEEPSAMLTNDEEGIYRSDNHLWLFTAPNGKIFQAGPSIQTHWIDVYGDSKEGGKITESILRGDDDDAMNGNVVMYDVGKLLTIGGAVDYGGVSPFPEGAPASRNCYVFDLNKGDEVTVVPTGSLRYGRIYGNSVVLPNGQVVVVGGMNHAEIFSDSGSVLEAELWDPETGIWIEIGAMTVPRNYHSTAILLQDGRVMASGGGQCGSFCGVNHGDAEILTPPYLRNQDGSTATSRPVFVAAPPATVSTGETFVVTMDKAYNHSFSLVRFGIVTHSINNDARRVPLAVKNHTSASSFRLTIPDNSAVVIPGTYFLFAMNSDGVPSIGSVVSVSVDSPSPYSFSEAVNGCSICATPDTDALISLPGEPFSDVPFLDEHTLVRRVQLKSSREGLLSLLRSNNPLLCGLGLTHISGATLRHGGVEGDAVDLELEANEHLTTATICGATGFLYFPGRISYLEVVTNLGRSTKAGRKLGLPWRKCKTYTAPENMSIVGFHGRAGKFLYELGLVYGSLS